jgi:hypothetical protein
VLDISFPTMGTMARVVRDVDGGVDAAAVFAEIERRLTRFDPASDLSRLNADPRVCVRRHRCSAPPSAPRCARPA